MVNKSPLLKVHGLKKYFPIKKGLLRRTVGHVRAVDDVDLVIREGETLSLVGESGCGKSTLSRCIVRAYRLTEGEILYRTERAGDRDGKNMSNGSQDEAPPHIVDLAQLNRRLLTPFRQEIQMIFQDPFSSLNPRMSLFEIIGEPLFVHGMTNANERRQRVAELLKLVGLRSEYMNRFPHAFSGGQRQRVGIARALALNPRLIIADEPVSALDVSVQAQILNLMLRLQEEFNLTYLFVAHDLSVVKLISHRVAVMYTGRIVEVADTENLYENPKHPYTAALLASVPKPDPKFRKKRETLPGEVADPSNPPSGCAFHPRCPYVIDKCKTDLPRLEETESGHYVRCHRARELDLPGITSLAEGFSTVHRQIERANIAKDIS